MTTISTVTGAVPAAGLGVVLGAEPLLSRGPARFPSTDAPASAAAFARESVRMRHLGRLAMGEQNLDDLVVDEALAHRAVDRFAAAGGGGIVALRARAAVWDPESLARLAAATGVRIVRAARRPAGAAPDPDALRAELDPSGTVPAGIVEAAAWEAGTVQAAGGAVPGDDPRASAGEGWLRASASAAATSGVALALHARGDWAAVERALTVLEAEGCSRNRVLLVGAAGLIADRSAGVGADAALVDRLIDLGPVACFDRLGRIPTVRTRVSDHDVAAALLRFGERGAAERAAVSSGISRKHRHTDYGGNGLEFVPAQFLAYLGALGGAPELVRAVGGDAVAALLARHLPVGVAA